ncbi:MAG: 3-deoxy-D-manno-octulosonic acid transferase [Microvirga sp.]
MSLPLVVSAYRRATALLEPAVLGLLYWRQRKGLEERTRLGERRGHPGRERPQGHLAWVHGASVGETLSLIPVIDRLTERGLSVLVTSGTRTSAGLIARRLPPGAFHQFVPLDVPRYLRRFLDHWRPDLTLVAESEIWPNTVLELDQRGIPLILVNGRMSDRSFRRWLRLPRIIGSLLERFALCLAQSPQDAERLARLGAARVVMAGNLKFDVSPPPADPRAVAQLSGCLAGRPVWLAASTHPGEEAIAVSVHRTLAQRFPNLVTIIAPRHPHRGDEIAAMARRAGLSAGQRSQGIPPDGATDIYVADTMGEMGLFYRLCPIVLVGGTLVPVGGHNPIEAAKLGGAILHGPHVHNAREIYAAIDDAHGALMVQDADGLARALDALLRDPSLTRAMARTATEVVNGLGGAVDRTMQSIEPFIVQAKIGGRR